MKNTVFGALIFLSLLSSACRKSEDARNYWQEAIITELDGRECGCCGGYFIQLEGVRRRFRTIPSGSNIEITGTNLPMRVKVRWQSLNKPCMPDLIEVLALEPAL